MADPLSIAGSAVGIVSLGLTAAQGLIQYYQAYRGQSGDVAHTTGKLERLLNLLESLQTLLSNRKADTRDGDILDKVNSYVEDSYEPIQELEERLKKLRKTSDRDIIASLQGFGRRLVYPLRKSTLQKLEADIDDSMQLISLALQLLQNGSLNRVQDDVATLLKLVEAASVSSEIRSWIKAPDASINFNEAAKKKHTGTGSWFVEGSQFQDWLVKPASFLWVVGFAGCGKSVLMTTTIEHTQRHRQLKQGIGIAFFFFTFNDETKQNCSAMLRSIILQLSGQLDQKDDPLAKLRRRSQSHFPTDQDFLDCLRELVLSFIDDVYIFIDALDESPPDKYRDEVLDALAKIRDWGEPRLHLIVSSRDYSDIRTSLLEESSDSDDIMVRMRNESIDKDIEIFVSQHLRTHRKFRKWKDHYDQIEVALVNGAQGVFRWVECQFAALARCPTSQHHLKRTLQSLPKSLDETYARMLRDVDPIYQEDVQRALNLLCCAKRPLLAEELMLAIAVELGDSPKYNSERQLKSSEDLQQICAGFIDIDIRSAKACDLSSEDPLVVEIDIHSTRGTCYEMVRIAHFSVQEFLKSDRIPKDFQDLVSFHVKIQDANDQMASTCLAFLLEPSILEVQSSIASPLACDTLSRHAARYWVDYFDESTSSTSTREQVLRLFRDKGGVFEKWIWVWKPQSDSKPRSTPLYYASLLGLRSVAYKLIEDGLSKELGSSSNAYSRVEPFFLDEEGGNRGTALQAASQYGNLEIVQRLIEGGANINQGSYKHGTALEAAAENGHLEIAQILITKGANIDQNIGVGGAPLHVASFHGHLEIVKLLIREGANIHQEDDYWGAPLQAASSTFGPPDIVQLLITEGANVNQQAGNCGTALQAASGYGNLEIVELLITKGANIKQQCGEYGGALQAAASGGYIEVVKRLLKEGANINQDSGYRTPTALQAASQRGQLGMVQFLVENGSNINQEAGYYGTALQAASMNNHFEVVQFLIERGACVNQKAGRHRTALQAAIEYSHKEIARLLLKEGAKTNQLSDDELSMLVVNEIIPEDIWLER